jgi:non-specific serine/threonine protein kinase
MITRDKLQPHFLRHYFEPHILLRGEQYQREGRVKILKISRDSITAEVSGASEYRVVVSFPEDHDLYAYCTCPHPDAFCKHAAATLLEASRHLEKNEAAFDSIHAKHAWEKLIHALDEARQPSDEAAYRAAFLLFVPPASPTWSLRVKRIRVRKDGSLGSFYALTGSLSQLQLTPEEEKVLPFLLYSRGYYSDKVELEFPKGEAPGRIFDNLRNSLLYLIDEPAPYYQSRFPIEKPQPLAVETDPAKLSIHLRELKDGSLQIGMWVHLRNKEIPLEDTQILTRDPIYLLHGNRLIRLENYGNGPVLQTLLWESVPSTIPEEALDLFLKDFLPRSGLSEFVQLPESWVIEPLTELTAPELYLREEPRGLQIDLKFRYGNQVVSLHDPQQMVFVAPGKKRTFYRLQRDVQAERRYADMLLRSGVQEVKGQFKLSRRKALWWLFEELPRLVEKGFSVYGEEKLRLFRVNRAQPQLRVQVSSDIDWFDIRVEVDYGGTPLPLSALKDALALNQRYVKLADGSLAILPEEWREKLAHVFSIGKVKKDHLKLSKFHIHLIDILASQSRTVRFDERYQEIREKLKNFSGITPQPVPKGFRGTLRPYQKSGFDWLCFLQEFGFGGCLADDMGLGKTVQALALLQREKEKGLDRPNLIVAPTSVLFNWKREVERFTPELKVYLHHGLKREKDPAYWRTFDIIITSYGTLLRDIKEFFEFPFHYVILDESQKIKNSLSKIARAVKLLKSRYRLILTGTPIENNTFELWSQFDFINPGLLGTQAYFRSAIARPIEVEGDETTAEFLRTLIYPFILRRTKEAVAKELPPKVESVSFCEMTPRQRKIYEKWRNAYRAELLELIETEGLNRSRMRILEGLMRLRQIACHPQLVEPGSRADSAKMEALFDLLEDILAEKHKALIYSQFVSMLTLIRKELDKRGIPYAYLDGRTRKRQEVVDRFQNDDSTPLFLISLRAGGLGLNLTAADYVIHYDPWWNPAVEIQATDRTHRIGQDKKIFSYKLITKDSVEEKILLLQEKKKKLADEIITTDTGFIKRLTREDIEYLFT